MKRVREIFFRRKAIRQEPQSEALVACLIFGLIFHGLMLEMHTLIKYKRENFDRLGKESFLRKIGHILAKKMTFFESK